MDEKDMALNELVEPENNETSTPEVNETAEEVVESELEDKEEAETTETEESPKKGYSSRVRELNARAKEAEEKAQSLSEKLEALTGGSSEEVEIPQYRSEPIVQPGEEIDAAELDRRLQVREARILQQADAMATLRSKRDEAANRIQNEAEKALQKYPELDPDSETFNRELSDAITEATEAYAIKNPYNASIIKFVDRMMRPYKGAVSKEVGEMTKSVAKQVSESALRPTNVRKEEKLAKEKSIAELESELGVIQA